MAAGVNDGFKILVTLDTGQIYSNSKEKEINALLSKYKVKITPTVDFAQITALEGRLKTIQQSQIVNLKIDESAALASVKNISSTISTSFNQNFSKNMTQVISSSELLATAFKNVGVAASSIDQSIEKINLLTGEKQNSRIDLFASRINKLAATLTNVGSEGGNLSNLQTFATNIANIIGTIQTSFDNNKITPRFDFSPRAIIGQFIQQKAAIQDLFLSDPNATIQLNAIPKFKTATDKDGKEALIKIPGTLDSAVTFANIKKVLDSISTQLMSSGVKIKVPADYQSIRESLSSIQIDLKFTPDSLQNIRTVNGELRAISQLSFENIKALKGVKLGSNNDNKILLGLNSIYENLAQVLTSVNEIKTKGISTDKSAAAASGQLIGSIDAEAEAYKRKRDAYDSSQRAYLNAVKAQANYKGESTSQTARDLQANVDAAKINMKSRLIELTKDEQAALTKTLEIEERNIRLAAQSKREQQILNEVRAAEKLNNELLQIDNKIGRNADIGKMTNSAQYQDYVRLRKKFNSEYQKLNTPGVSPAQAQVHLDNLTRIHGQIIGINKEIMNSSSANQLAAKDADKVSRINQELISYMNRYGSEIKQNTDLYRRFVELQNKLKNGGIGHTEAKQQFATLRQEARGLGLEVDNIWKKLKRTFAMRGRGWLASQGWMLLHRSVRDLWRNVVELDTAMTELKKVTTATADEYDQFLKNAETRAQKLGATLKDVVSASADMARLGYNIEDASTLADTAILYKNVGDDIENIDDASKAIISTMQGFNIEAEKSMDIVDKYNEVANNYASSAGDIGEIIKRSAAAMNVSGASLDETIALGVTANEVVQDADVVGNALKTMSMRLRSTKSEMETAGEDTDGMASSVSKLRSEIQALSGVDIQIDEETYKNPYEMLMQIGEVWDELSDISKANIGELLFGKRQANIGFAILENYERAQEILNTSLDSSGSAENEQKRYMDSIQGKMNSLNATWESFSNNLLDSSYVKEAVDGINTLLKGLNAVADVLGSLPVLVFAATQSLASIGKSVGKTVPSYRKSTGQALGCR